VNSLTVVLGSVPFNWLSLHSHFRSDAAFGPLLSFLVTEILQNTHFDPEICEFQNALLVFDSYSWVKSTGYIQGPSRGPGTPYSLGVWSQDVWYRTSGAHFEQKSCIAPFQRCDFVNYDGAWLVAWY